MPNTPSGWGSVRGWSLGVGGLLVLIIVSLAIGTRSITPFEVVRALVAFDASDDHVVVRELRLPRTLVALVVGAALGVAGAVAQTVTRNPLADPGLLGVNAGAALAVVVGIAVFDVATLRGRVASGIAGAAIAAVLVAAIGGGGGERRGPARLALAGLALTTTFGAATSTIVLVDRRTLDQFRFWAAGSLAGRDLGQLVSVLPFVAAGLACAAWAAPAFGSLALGDDAARALGVRLGRTRVLAGAAVALLAGTATALCGPIAFVGLAVPHLVRLVARVDATRVLAGSVVVGPAVLLLADVLGRVVVRPAEVQAGIVAAVLGGPMLTLLARRGLGGVR